MSERIQSYLRLIDSRLKRTIELDGPLTDMEAALLHLGLLRRVLDGALGKHLLPAQIDQITIDLVHTIASLRADVIADTRKDA
jgi:hypothetical protein